MKTTFTNAQCAHVWAQQTQPRGSSSGMHFDGAVIYSYQTPIAMFHNTPQGQVCLITSQSYSVTTSSKHYPAVRDAVRGDVPVFYVPWVGLQSGRGRDNSEPSHAANMQALIDVYHGTASTASKARNEPYELLERLTRAAEAAKGYAKAFGQPRPYFAPCKLHAGIMAVRAERGTPEGKAKRAKAAAARKAKETRENAARVSAWRAGDPLQLANGAALDEHGGALLRIVRRGSSILGSSIVQTSRGAEVPLSEAKRLLAYYQETIKGKSRPDVVCLPAMYARVGPFHAERINADNSIEIGCHKISAQEIERFAELVKPEPGSIAEVNEAQRRRDAKRVQS